MKWQILTNPSIRPAGITASKYWIANAGSLQAIVWPHDLGGWLWSVSRSMPARPFRIEDQNEAHSFEDAKKDAEAAIEHALRPGRPVVGDKPMTSTERSKRRTGRLAAMETAANE